MKLQKYIVAAALVALAACSGGGGGSNPIPVVQPTPVVTSSPQSHASLRIKGGNGATTQGRIHRMAVPQDLGGITPPFLGDFAIADFATQLDAHVQTSASAYYDTSAAPAPSPLPSITWTATGTAMTLSSLAPPVNSGTTVYAGSVLVGASTALGQATVVATASNGDVATATGNVYRGTALADAASTTDPHGLTFDASGSHPVDSGSVITIDDSGDITVVNAPGGVVLVTKPIDKVKASDYVNPVTSLPANICSGAATLVFMTPSGLVKWMPSAYVWPSGTCKWTDAYGPYQLATGGAFSY